MNSLTAKDERYNSEYENQEMREHGPMVELISIADRARSLKSLELFDATSCNCGSGTGVGPRTISCSNHLALLKIEPTHLALVDGTAVIPAGRRRSESLNLSALSSSIMSDDAHGVSSLNFLNILPANFVAAERIDNHYPFIEINYSRMKKHLVGNGASKGAPNRSNKSAGKTVVKEVYVGERAEEKEAQESAEIRTRRAEELAISHDDIFSCADIAGAIETRVA